MRQCAPYVDCASISCGNMPRSEIEKQMTLIRKFGCRHIVIATRGSQGGAGNGWTDVSARTVTMFGRGGGYHMGAGDSFITCFLINCVDAKTRTPGTSRQHRELKEQ
ncbi:MAG: hypothetical protein ACLR0U_33920 [Enterocloster clostridioformis]